MCKGLIFMPQRTSYQEGTPSWVDLQTTDVEAAKAFYGGLFGWKFDDQPMPDNGVYSMALVGADTVAAIAPQAPMQVQMGVPPLWNTYIAVDSVDDAVAKAGGAGGTVLMPATDIPGAGRMAFVADPTGAAVGLWQASGHIGATLVNEPNTLTWNELTTSDNATALPFYRAVAGIESAPTKMGDTEYTLLKVDGADVGGATSPQMDGVPNHWHVWFAVADTDVTAASAAAAGGSLLVPPMDMPIGKIATIRDPQGAAFSILGPRPGA
jgi:predicted enzyme related to lactoylglutathione lyase